MAGLQDYQAREYLLNVLKDRGIPLGSDDIAWAFASSKTRDKAIAWVKEYLQDATLLTSNELASLESDAAKNNTSPEKFLAVLDEESIRYAIESLQASTVMIEKHTKTLEAQKELLEKFQDSQQQHNNVPESPRKTLGNSINRADITLENSVNAFKEDLYNADKQSSRAMNSAQSLINERLKADDDVMQALSKLAPKTLPSDSSSAPSINSTTIEKWCQALILLRENEINSQIDATINTHIANLILTSEPSSPSSPTPPALEQSEAELSALRQEIHSVSQLVVESELRQPLSRLLTTSQSSTITSQREWLNYVLHTFDHMIAQLSLISNHIDSLQSIDNALARIRSEFLSTSNNRAPPNPSTTNASTTASSSSSFTRPPMHSRSNSRVGSSSSNANANASIQQPAGSGSTLDTALKRFGAASVAELGKAADGNLQKMRETYAGVVQSTAEIVGKALLHGGGTVVEGGGGGGMGVMGRQRQQQQQQENGGLGASTVQAALEQVYAHSEWSTVALSSQYLEKEITELDKAIEQTVGLMSEAENGRHEDIRALLKRATTKN